VAAAGRKKQDDISARKLAKKSLKSSVGLLRFIGKPFYFTVYATLYVAYITGYATRLFLTYILITYIPKGLRRLIEGIKFDLYKLHKLFTKLFPEPPSIKPGVYITASKAKGIIFRSKKGLSFPFAKKVSHTYKLTRIIALYTLINALSLLIFLQTLLSLIAINIKYALRKVILSLIDRIKEILDTAASTIAKGGVKFRLTAKSVKDNFYKSSKTKSKEVKKAINNLKKAKPQIRLPEISPTFNRALVHLKNLKVGYTKAVTNTKLTLLKLRLKASAIKPQAPRIKFPRISKLKILSSIFVFMFSIGLITASLYWYFILRDLPSPQQLTRRQVDVSTKIYDRNGVLLYTIYKDQNRTPVPLQDIPNNVKLATIAIEDAEFYTHPGFSIRGISRALIKNIERKELTGGSTITQQLVKNALLTPEKTIVRKLKEVTLAIQVEINYSKDEILEMYLNEVSYGGTAYGIQEAARTYFDKDVKDLTLAEAALLAGLPKSPTAYSPFGPNKDASLARQKEVLNLMKINGFISEKAMKSALNQKLTFANKRTNIKAPHFVMYVRENLEQEYGENVVERSGLDVITTLDYRIQELAERVVKEEVNSLAGLHVTNGAAIVLHPATGEILAMVGSKDYFDYEDDGNVNVTTSPRQPGSSIKVVNYAYALSHGYTPATIVKDIPTTFHVEGQPPYSPKNYEGEFRGNLTLRSAFAESRNVPAVRVLASYGVYKMFDMGRKMGITTWNNPSQYGLSLTLGGGEVKLIDLAQVYATVANYGKKPPITSVLSIKNYQDKKIETNACAQKDKPAFIALAEKFSSRAIASESATNLGSTENMSTNCGEQILDPRVAYLITDILKDNDARSPSFGRNSVLVIPNHKEIAVKTGTSNNLRDNLTIGYNQKYLVAVWVGNNDNSPMSRIASGVTGASSIFNKIMSTLVAEDENHDWVVPPGLTKQVICPYTGTLSCSGCPKKEEWFLEENKPDRVCSPEWFEKKDGEEKDSKNNNDTKPAESIYYQDFYQLLDGNSNLIINQDRSKRLQ
jgi:penicillin-binding protein 1C